MLTLSLLLKIQQVLLDAGLDEVSFAAVKLKEELDPEIIERSDTPPPAEYTLRCYGRGFLDKVNLLDTKAGVSFRWTLHDKLNVVKADELHKLLQYEPMKEFVRRNG